MAQPIVRAVLSRDGGVLRWFAPVVHSPPLTAPPAEPGGSAECEPLKAAGTAPLRGALSRLKAADPRRQCAS